MKTPDNLIPNHTSNPTESLDSASLNYLNYGDFGQQ
jgi:hypothetical protein